MDLNTVLRNAQHPDQGIRAQAEAQLNGAIEQQYGPFVMALVTELATEGGAPENRQLAGLFLKNVIVAQDASIHEAKIAKWTQCDNGMKDQIRAGFLRALHSPVPVVSHTAAQVVAAFGAVDTQNGQWAGLLPALLHSVNDPNVPLQTKIASLEALGFMADDMEPDRLPKSTVDQILTTIVSGMQKDLPNEMRRAAVGALLNSLSFTHHNFDVDGERNAIMTVVCEATQCSDVQVRVKAFECISDIATMYYSKLGDYAKALFDITSNAIKNDDPLVGQYAIEFWSSVAEEEYEVLDNLDNGESEGTVLLGLVEGAAQSLVPILLETLTKQTSDTADDDDEWNIALASAACIEKLTLVLGDKIIDQVLPFVGAYVTNADWKFREAAIMSFASILEGTSSHKMDPIIAGGLGALIPCLGDNSPIVRDSTAWAISRVFQFHPTAVTPAMLPSVVEAVLRTLQDRNPRIACLAALALHHMADACQDSADQQTNTLSPFFVTVLGSLFQVSARPDGDEGNLAATAYEAINVMIANSALDTKPLVIQSMTEIIGRLETTVNVAGDMHDRLTLQSLLCGSLGACVQKLDKESVMPHSDRIMHLLLMVFKEKSAIAHEDAFITSGFIADTLQGDFIRYMPHFIEPLLQGLRHVDEHSVVVMAAGVVGDLSRALQKQLAPYAEPIMTHLVQLLQSPVLHRIAKPNVISAFADVAMAIEDGFVPYLNVVMQVLHGASGVEITNDTDDDMVEYINTLRESILEAYTGIVQGLKDTQAKENIVPFLDGIVGFVNRVSVDEYKSSDVLKGSIGLIGDLTECFGQRMAPLLVQPFVKQMLAEGEQYEETQQLVSWARKLVKKFGGK